MSRGFKVATLVIAAALLYLIFMTALGPAEKKTKEVASRTPVDVTVEETVEKTVEVESAGSKAERAAKKAEREAQEAAQAAAKAAEIQRQIDEAQYSSGGDNIDAPNLPNPDLPNIPGSHCVGVASLGSAYDWAYKGVGRYWRA